MLVLVGHGFFFFLGQGYTVSFVHDCKRQPSKTDAKRDKDFEVSPHH